VDPYLQALIDPFALNSEKVKVPDMYNFPSVAQKLLGTKKVMTDANGNTAIVIRPWIRSFYGVAPVTIPLGIFNVDWTTTTYVDNPYLANYYAVMMLARVVAYGIRCTYIGSREQCEGTVHFGIIPDNFAVDAQGDNCFPISLDQMAATPYYQTYALSDMVNKQIVVPGRPIDLGAQRYRDTAAPLSDTSWIESSDGWSAIVIFFEGCPPDTEIMNIEYSYHMEGLQRTGSAGSGAFIETTPARNYDPKVLARAAELGVKLPPTYEREDQYSDFKDMIDKIATGVGYAVDIGKVLGKLFV